jgi:hypothetical protein
MPGNSEVVSFQAATRKERSAAKQWQRSPQLDVDTQMTTHSFLKGKVQWD